MEKGVLLWVLPITDQLLGIAKALSDAGAELAFSYQGEAIEKRIIPLARELNSNITIECDVSDEASIINLINEIEKV